MKNFIVQFCFLFLTISLITFVFGILRLIFNREDRKFSLQIILYSVIAFIIGLGTCVATVYN